MALPRSGFCLPGSGQVQARLHRGVRRDDYAAADGGAVHRGHRRQGQVKYDRDRRCTSMYSARTLGDRLDSTGSGPGDCLKREGRRASMGKDYGQCRGSGSHLGPAVGYTLLHLSSVHSRGLPGLAHCQLSIKRPEVAVPCDHAGTAERVSSSGGKCAWDQRAACRLEVACQMPRVAARCLQTSVHQPRPNGGPQKARAEPDCPRHLNP